MVTHTSPVIVALDFDNITDARTLVKQLSPACCRLKVGKEMFTLFGPDWVRELVDHGYDVFLDLKFHDIPNTVAKACKAACELGVWMTNVHASGGSEMMRAAKEAVLQSKRPETLLTAVTVLTSMNVEQLHAIVPDVTIDHQVSRLALLAKDAGLDGVVCSGQEAILLRQLCGNDFCLVTPGIRPAGSALGDQKRVLTPSDAIAQGVDYLVIGRPITQAKDPKAVLLSINQSLGV